MADRDREEQIIETAATMGYLISKSSTPTNSWNKGGFMLLRQGCVVIGDRFDASLDEIAALLEAEGAKLLSEGGSHS